jgi:CRISPR-associated protein Cas1
MEQSKYSGGGSMPCLYVTEQGSQMTVEQGYFVVNCKDGSRTLVPKETLESVVIFGNVAVTVPCMKECLLRGINVSLLSTKGQYFGRLVSTRHVNAIRLKNQIYLSDTESFSLAFSAKILKAKMHNQAVLLRRYSRTAKKDLTSEINDILYYEKKIDSCQSIEEMMGYEGIAARNYFDGLARIIHEEFRFKGRNRRPPKDPFNALISLGYTIVFYEIYAELENRGLSPYIGYMHKIKEHHPALVSDLLEEWRAVIVDAAVMSLIQGNEITPDEFTYDEETEGVIISNNGVRLLMKKLEQKMRMNMNYLGYLENPVSFRRGIWWQVKTLAHCIDVKNIDDYEPLRIR